MATRRKKKVVKIPEPNIRVRLDSKTVITLKDASKLEFWKQRYPKLVVLEG
ncbi:MAG: hypothetical protein MK081_12270 [Flavobacteriales bacterium]|uniref:hypothetical protein n=1 Tax=Sanyastnella coralliicola TaxID=3069118 RepID=UPI0027B9534A|nr:hypothetical protein [Longitalea sp. SCSIO 12813]MCH2199547.1 hypothetical protein [Flavobacteriales bacterium]